MPPSREPVPEKSLQQIVEELGLYPIEAFEFVQQGLTYTVNKIHGAEEQPRPKTRGRGPGDPSRHVDGPQLCAGLRELALQNWGLLARTVLKRWNVTKTSDFGRIVFALVASGYMQKTQNDTLDDFRDVYDFAAAFEDGYRIEQAK
jgi:uncharacterized repeat protein (TIGR04138 family)